MVINIDRCNPCKKNLGGGTGICNNFYESRGVRKLRSLRATGAGLVFLRQGVPGSWTQGPGPISVLIWGLLRVCVLEVQCEKSAPASPGRGKGFESALFTRTKGLLSTSVRGRASLSPPGGPKSGRMKPGAWIIRAEPEKRLYLESAGLESGGRVEGLGDYGCRREGERGGHQSHW